MVVALGPDELMKQIYCLSAIKLWQGTIPSNGDLPPVIGLLPEVLCPLGVAWSAPCRQGATRAAQCAAPGPRLPGLIGVAGSPCRRGSAPLRRKVLD